MDVESVGSRTRFADVAHLGKHRAFNGRVQVRVFTHDERSISTQFHGRLHDVLGSLFQEPDSHAGGPGKGHFARNPGFHPGGDNTAG